MTTSSPSNPPLGVIPDEPIETYHASDAWSKTKLDVFHRSPAWAYEKYVAKSIPRDTDTSAFKKGRAIHCLVLEGPAAFKQRYVCEPDFGDCRQKANKEVRDAWRLDNAGMEILSRSDYELAHRVALSANSNPALAAIILHGKPEVTFRAELSHFRVQARPDMFVENVSGTLAALLHDDYGLVGVEEGQPLILDLKSTATLDDDDFGAFSKQFYNYGYFRSPSFYNSVVGLVLNRPIKLFVFAAVETEQPHEMQLYVPNADALWAGFEEVSSDLNDLRKCYETGVWPSRRKPGFEMIGVPDWYARRLAEKRRAMP